MQLKKMLMEKMKNVKKKIKEEEKNVKQNNIVNLKT